MCVGKVACRNKKKINNEREKSSSHALRAREKSRSKYNRNNNALHRINRMIIMLRKIKNTIEIIPLIQAKLIRLSRL